MRSKERIRAATSFIDLHGTIKELKQIILDHAQRFLNKDDMIADLEMIIQVQQKKLNERNGKNAKGEEEKTKTNIKE